MALPPFNIDDYPNQRRRLQRKQIGYPSSYLMGSFTIWELRAIADLMEVRREKKKPNCAICKWCLNLGLGNMCEVHYNLSTSRVYNDEVCQNVFEEKHEKEKAQ